LLRPFRLEICFARDMRSSPGLAPALAASRRPVSTERYHTGEDIVARTEFLNRTARATRGITSS
jgi:hypothetical protein